MDDLDRAAIDHSPLLATGADGSAHNEVRLAMAGRGRDDVKAVNACD